jgi:hypothetical protein
MDNTQKQKIVIAIQHYLAYLERRLSTETDIFSIELLKNSHYEYRNILLTFFDVQYPVKIEDLS